MEKNKEKALNNFINALEDDENTDIQVDNNKKIVLDEREGLIERVDKVYVTKDGKQLLREHY